MRKAYLEQAFRNNIIPIGINAEWVEKRNKKGKKIDSKIQKQEGMDIFQSRKDSNLLVAPEAWKRIAGYKG